MNRNILILTLAVIALSCGNPTQIKENSKANTVIKINNIPKIKSVKYSDLFESIRIVKLETTSESLIGRIDKILHYHDMFFILDQVNSKSVLVFDSNGKYLRKIGNNGRGPGEYDEPNDIAIDRFNNNLIVYQHTGKKLLTYSFDGAFLEEIKLKFYIKSFNIINRDAIAVYFDNGPDTPNESKYNMLIINKKGKVLNTAFEIDQNTPFSKGGFGFFNVNMSDDELIVSPGYSNKIYTVLQDSLRLKYFIDFGMHNIPMDFWANSGKTDFIKKLRASDYAFLINQFETPGYLSFSFSYKSMVYNSFYSKESGTLIFGNYLLNDMYGLIVGGPLLACDEDLMITSHDPTNIEGIKEIYNFSSTDGTKMKKRLLENLDAVNNSNGEMGMLKKNLETAVFKPTKEEIANIGSINPTDNPILIVHKLKPF